MYVVYTMYRTGKAYAETGLLSWEHALKMFNHYEKNYGIFRHFIKEEEPFTQFTL